MTLFLIDGHAIAYRSYYALIRNPLTNSRGENTSAVYGFVRLILRLLEKYAPDHIAVTFDSEEETGRHQQYEEYKANREPMPDDMQHQIPVIVELMEALGVPVLFAPGYEADDIIATLAKEAENDGLDVRIISSDKDLFQLLSDRVKMIRPSKGNDLEDETGPEYLKKRFGLKPSQIGDLLAMMGDSADNIPGVKGIGEKTALSLLVKYGSLDEVLRKAEEIEPAHVSRKISEGKEEAIFSRTLVELVDVPLDMGYRDMVKSDMDEEKVTEILLDMEFHQIIKDLRLGERETVDRAYSLVDEKGLDELASILRESGDFALDTETTSIDPLEAELVGIAFSTEKGRAWYVPVETLTAESPDELFPDDESVSQGISLEMVRDKLGSVLADPSLTKTGQNIKYDLIVLESHGFAVEGVDWDTMIASYCIDPSRRSHSLDNLVMEYCRYRMIPYGDLFEKRDRIKDIRKVPVERLCEYACEDADFTYRLKEIFSALLEEDDLEDLFENVEMPLSFVLKRMEQEGMTLDTERLGKLSEEISTELERLTEGIYAVAGEEFNINSNQQLQRILFEKLGLPPGKKTKTGYSTDVTVLTELAVEHEIAALMLDYRQMSKMSSTYVDNLPRLVNYKTGKIHTSFNQTVTSTGRLSSSDPNLQNIPIRTEPGRQIRSAFIPSDGRILLDADYSQVELRIMAHLSKDPGLVAAFRDECDIHTRTASKIFEVDEAEVTRAMRSAAKTINFGLMYGQGARALSQQLRIPLEEAKDFIDGYFEQYPGIAEFIEESKEMARKKGYAETLMGRRRPLPDINSSNGRFRSFAERNAVNTPIQGTAADMIKIAMINIDTEIMRRGLESSMILQVHDELVFDVVPDEIDTMKDLVRELMESAIKLDVPLKVDMDTGDNWLEAH
ncbi:MAG: DNA polymerase I [Candidatus Krumholzibacteria bacterium]|nr:DNA polymerase I [Candidatus Krumholzibacteria bacterium]